MSDENPFGNIDLGSLVSKARGLQEQLQKAQEKAAGITAEGASGGGMVKATANGHGEVLRVQLDPALVEMKDREMIEDLVVAAVNQATKKAREAAEVEMKNATGGIPLPGDLSKLFG